LALNPETKNLENTEQSKKIPYKRCNETINEPKFNELKNPELWNCFDLNIEGLEFGGNWDGEFVNFFMFHLNICEHDKNEIPIKETCLNFEKLKEFLNKRIFISINVPQVYFDFTDFEDPLKIEYKVYFSKISRNILRADICHFNFPLMKDDRGWIFSDYQYETNISIDYCDQKIDWKNDYDYFNPSSDDILYGMDIYLDKSYTYYIRTYMKFQDLVAIVGGFIKLITLIFAFLNFFFNEYERDKMIINYFFNSFDSNYEDENILKKVDINQIDNLNPKSISNSNTLIAILINKTAIYF